MVPIIWMTNDPGGFVRISDLYMWIKFSDSAERQFRINVKEVMAKLKERSGDQFEIPGLIFFPDVATEDKVKVTGILLLDIDDDSDQAIVTTFDLREALYYWIG